jgi:two-component system chemotaxis response regulator CheY
MRCLIVEDEDFGREMLKCLLADYSKSIDTARNGADALQRFELALRDKNPYHFICLDIMMPVMDGQEALKRMRHLEKEASIPHDQAAIIVMTTALDSLQEIEKAIWEGDCNDYLVKPVSQADLIALMRKYKLID